MVLSESLLCETPVITLSTPWADNSQGEVIGNCVGGFVASKKSQLKRLIEELLFDEQLRNDMAVQDEKGPLIYTTTMPRKSLNVINSFEFDFFSLIHHFRFLWIALALLTSFLVYYLKVASFLSFWSILLVFLLEDILSDFKRWCD